MIDTYLATLLRNEDTAEVLQNDSEKKKRLCL